MSSLFNSLAFRILSYLLTLLFMSAIVRFSHLVYSLPIGLFLRSINSEFMLRYSNRRHHFRLISPKPDFEVLPKCTHNVPANQWWSLSQTYRLQLKTSGNLKHETKTNRMTCTSGATFSTKCSVVKDVTDLRN